MAQCFNDIFNRHYVVSVNSKFLTISRKLNEFTTHFQPFTLFRTTKDICMDLQALLLVWRGNCNNDKKTQITNILKTSRPLPQLWLAAEVPMWNRTPLLFLLLSLPRVLLDNRRTRRIKLMDTFSSDVKVVNLLTTSPIEDDRRSFLAILSDSDRDTGAWLMIGILGITEPAALLYCSNGVSQPLLCISNFLVQTNRFLAIFSCAL